MTVPKFSKGEFVRVNAPGLGFVSTGSQIIHREFAPEGSRELIVNTGRVESMPFAMWFYGFNECGSLLAETYLSPIPPHEPSEHKTWEELRHDLETTTPAKAAGNG